MAANFSDQSVEGVNGFQCQATCNQDTTNPPHHIGTEVGAGMAGMEVNATHLLPMLGEMLSDMKAMIKRQNEMDGSLQLLVKKVLERDEHANGNGQGWKKGDNVNTEENTVLAQPICNKTDWDNIKLEPFQKDDDDVYVDISEDDGYFHDMGSKKNKMKMSFDLAQCSQQSHKVQHFIKSEHDMYYNVEKGRDLKVLASNFKRGITFNESSPMKDNEGTVESWMQPRKLSFTPSSAFKKQKMIELEPQRKCTPKKRDDWKDTNPKEPHQMKNWLLDVDPRITQRTKFMPSTDMKLTPEEVHLCLYIFQVEGELSESLTRIGTTIGTRMVLETLCPDKVIDREATRFQRPFFSPYYYMDEWEISQPEGLPTSQNGENSAIWVLDWMSMADGFTTNFSPQINEKHVRMRLAIDLVNGGHNEYWEEIHGKVEAFWKRIRTPQNGLNDSLIGYVLQTTFCGQ
ncbi:hypothetical protein SESBI_00121 [Sesbania bispinosa]|nr:hypothetical protein SESBI_00121 [Sesbania bispinosa]